jgi:hypothetical protein
MSDFKCYSCGGNRELPGRICPLCGAEDAAMPLGAYVEMDGLHARLAEATARNAQILRDFHAEIHDGQSESAHDVIQRLVREKQEATARAERAEGENANLRDTIFNLLGSARPNPLEHPSMFAAWEKAKKLLSDTTPPQRTDGERLDWLESNQTGVFVFESPKRHSHPNTEYQFEGYAVGFSDVPLPTIRQAIDAAMSTEPEELK